MTLKLKSNRVNIALWVVQGILAFAFASSGTLKIIQPMEKLIQAGMTFVSNYDHNTVRLIGFSEILAALGLILPPLFRIKPSLTPIAAVGLAIIMILASHYHFSHNESFLPNLILLILALFVAWGRLKLVPIQGK